MAKTWLDIGQAAVHFGVSAKTVRRWIDQSKKLKMEAEKRSGRWYINADSVTFRESADKKEDITAGAADLNAALKEERQRTTTAIMEVGVWRGRYEEQQKMIAYHNDQEQSKEEKIAALEEKVEKLGKRGLFSRIFNSGS